MSERTDILISLHSRYINSLLNGEKSVELRRRPISLPSMARVWIYGIRPLARLEAVGYVQKVDHLAPDDIWSHHGARTGITEVEFNDYFKGVTTGSAIIFSQVVRLMERPTLEDLRRALGSFHPPQFYRKLDHAGPELALFCAALPS